VKSNGQSLDEGEDIATLELTREELGAAIERGEMRNALSLLAIARVFDMRNGDWR
jgi:DNA polymerase III delta prime subunit